MLAAEGKGYLKETLLESFIWTREEEFEFFFLLERGREGSWQSFHGVPVPGGPFQGETKGYHGTNTFFVIFFFSFLFFSNSPK